ncbi:MAG: penicillin-binding protein 1A [Pseudohongiellaceae bacterium]
MKIVSKGVTHKILSRAIRFLSWWALAGLCGLLMLASAEFLYLSPKLPTRESYTNIRLENPLRIFTRDGRLLAEFGSRRSDPLKYEAIPARVVQAVVSSEDKRFYDHNGVDLLGLVRSIAGILLGNDWGGGSTITMQVTKNFFFEGESAYSRKFKEILLAIKMERELSKQEILELYLNRTFFGISAYGIQAASRQYYDKSVEQLTLAEIATLIGIMPRPNAYNPLQSPELALLERGRVLRRMRDQGMITMTEYDEALASPETADRYGRQPELSAPYVAEMVRLEMMKRYGELALTDGFEVHTTIDSKMQVAANQALIRGLENYDRNHGFRGREDHIDPARDGSVQAWLSHLSNVQTVNGQIPAFVTAVGERSLDVLLKGGERLTLDWEGLRWAKRFINNSSWTSSPKAAAEIAEPGDLVRVTRNAEGKWILGQVPAVNGGLVSLDPDNGAIMALTGGYDFFTNSFNRVTQARRQPGSNFKPFLYSAALDNGYTAASLINDAPLARADYRPSNFEGDFMGPIRLKYALTQSKNLVSLRLYEALGEDLVMPYIGRFGFHQAEFPRNDLTIALGSHAVYPIEMATAYTVFANGGYKVEPWLIERIVNFNDGEVYRATPTTVCHDCEAAVPAATNAEIAAGAPEGAATATVEQPSLPQAPRVLDERTAYIMHSILRSVVTEGSGRPVARAIKRNDLAGKTGTSNDANDLWFSGFNGDFVTTVYVGFDQPQSLGRQEQAATVALPIWIDFMKVVLEGKPEAAMAQPNGIVTVRINRDTGLRAQPDEAGAIFEVFREEDLPGYALPAGNGTVPGAKPGSVGIDELF